MSSASNPGPTRAEQRRVFNKFRADLVERAFDSGIFASTPVAEAEAKLVHKLLYSVFKARCFSDAGMVLCRPVRNAELEVLEVHSISELISLIHGRKDHILRSSVTVEMLSFIYFVVSGERVSLEDVRIALFNAVKADLESTDVALSAGVEEAKSDEATKHGFTEAVQTVLSSPAHLLAKKRETESNKLAGQLLWVDQGELTDLIQKNLEYIQVLYQMFGSASTSTPAPNFVDFSKDFIEVHMFLCSSGIKDLDAMKAAIESGHFWSLGLEMLGLLYNFTKGVARLDMLRGLNPLCLKVVKPETQETLCNDLDLGLNKTLKDRGYASFMISICRNDDKQEGEIHIVVHVREGSEDKVAESKIRDAFRGLDLFRLICFTVHLTACVSVPDSPEEIEGCAKCFSLRLWVVNGVRNEITHSQVKETLRHFSAKLLVCSSSSATTSIFRGAGAGAGHGELRVDPGFDSDCSEPGI